MVTTHRFTSEQCFDGAALVVDSAGEPDEPFTLAAGDACGQRWLTVDLFDQILTRRAAREDLPDALRASA